jgi:hypothetical protein
MREYLRSGFIGMVSFCLGYRLISFSFGVIDGMLPIEWWIIAGLTGYFTFRSLAHHLRVFSRFGSALLDFAARTTPLILKIAIASEEFLKLVLSVLEYLNSTGNSED